MTHWEATWAPSHRRSLTTSWPGSKAEKPTIFVGWFSNLTAVFDRSVMICLLKKKKNWSFKTGGVNCGKLCPGSGIKAKKVRPTHGQRRTPYLGRELQKTVKTGRNRDWKNGFISFWDEKSADFLVFLSDLWSACQPNLQMFAVCFCHFGAAPWDLPRPCIASRWFSSDAHWLLMMLNWQMWDFETVI